MRKEREERKGNEEEQGRGKREERERRKWNDDEYYDVSIDLALVMLIVSRKFHVRVTETLLVEWRFSGMGGQTDVNH